MIIKFQEKDKWVLFGEIDHLEYEELGNGSNGGIDGSVLIYEPSNNPRPVKDKYFALSFFTKNMTEATIIHCYSPIYLMNDDGKTVEII